MTVILGVLLWVFRGILLPFLLGIALAFLLNPVVDWLERKKINRMWAVIIVSVVMIILTTAAFLLVVPVIMQQLFSFVRNIPDYYSQLQSMVVSEAPRVEALLGPERYAELNRGLQQMFANGLGMVTSITGQIMQSSMNLLSALSVVVVTPVVTFYLLLDWDKMVNSVNGLIPPKHKTEVQAVLVEMEAALSGFVRGQGAVVLILAIFYATALSLSGLSFGLAIGLMAGLFSFIPYVGALIGFVLSIGVALVQFWPEWPRIAVIFGIYLVGQFLEGNVLYPKLVGSSIGVHPVWLMFSLFAFAVLFGAVGVLIAVPLAAISGVLVRWGVRKYKGSPLYEANIIKPQDAVKL